jgi:hypothetical protein
VCHQVHYIVRQNVYKKKCLLEYLSIDEEDYKLKVKRLTFEVNINDDDKKDCVKDFKEELDEQKTCKLDEFRTGFPNFYIPLDSNNVGFLKFISETGTLLHAEGENFIEINQSQIQITIEEYNAKLEFQNKIYNFGIVNSCYFLLNKLNEWTRIKRCSNENKLLFTNIEISPQKENIPKQEGHLELFQNSRFSLGGEENFFLKKIEIKDIKPIYYLYIEGVQFKVELWDGANSYTLFYKYMYEYCLDRIKHKLPIYNSCAFYGGKNLFYYDQVNLQNPNSVEKISGQYEFIHFVDDKAEIFDNDQKRINSVKVYDMDLVQKEQQWLYIKGLDVLTNNLFNKKFLVKSCDCCYKRFKNKFSKHYIEMNKVLLWEPDKDSPTAIEARLTTLGEIVYLEKQKPLKLIQDGRGLFYNFNRGIWKYDELDLRVIIETDERGKEVKSDRMTFKLGFGYLDRLTVMALNITQNRKIK